MNVKVAVAGWVLLLGVAGCPDPKGKYDDFVARTPVADGSVVDAAASTVFDINGRFLLAVKPPFSDDPLQFLMTNVMTMNPDGTATVTISGRALKVGDRTEIGPVTMTPPGVVDKQGQFSLSLAQTMVPGDANPISGSDITADITLQGTLLSADLVCGIVTGSVTQPFVVDLAGSTFAAIRVADGLIGATLPAPVFKCPATVTPDGGVTPDAAPPDAETPDADTPDA